MRDIDKDLITASEYGHLNVVKELVSIGADVTAWDNSAVRRASWYGHTKVVEYIKSLNKEKVS